VTKLLEKETPRVEISQQQISSAMSLIKSISCNASDENATDLLDFLCDEEATLEALDSQDTPILSSGLDIELPLHQNDVIAIDPPTKKQRKN